MDLSRDYVHCTHCTLYRTEDLREWGDLIRSCVVKKKDEFGQVGPAKHIAEQYFCYLGGEISSNWATN